MVHAVCLKGARKQAGRAMALSVLMVGAMLVAASASAEELSVETGDALIEASLAQAEGEAVTTARRDRIWVPRIRDWQDVDRHSLIIYGPVRKDPYLVTLWPTCSGLRFANGIGYSTTNNWLTKFDTIFVRGQRCPIESIEPISVEQAKALLNPPEEAEPAEIDG